MSVTENGETKIAYIQLRATDLIRECIELLAAQTTLDDAQKIMLRGTLPKSALEKLQSNVVVLDPKNLGNRFHDKKRYYVDGFSELLNLGAITHYYDGFGAQKGIDFLACIGIETKYKSSELHEKYLADGAIASGAIGARQIVQSCMAQNITNDMSDPLIDNEIIKQLVRKLDNSPNEPSRILAVSVWTNEDVSLNDINFVKIANDTIAKYKEKTSYSEIFCIVMSTDKTKMRINVIPLTNFLPDGNGIIGIIRQEDIL